MQFVSRRLVFAVVCTLAQNCTGMLNTIDLDEGGELGQGDQQCAQQLGLVSVDLLG